MRHYFLDIGFCSCDRELTNDAAINHRDDVSRLRGEEARVRQRRIPMKANEANSEKGPSQVREFARDMIGFAASALTQGSWRSETRSNQVENCAREP